MKKTYILLLLVLSSTQVFAGLGFNRSQMEELYGQHVEKKGTFTHETSYTYVNGKQRIKVVYQNDGVVEIAYYYGQLHNTQKLTKSQLESILKANNKADGTWVQYRAGNKNAWFWTPKGGDLWFARADLTYYGGIMVLRRKAYAAILAKKFKVVAIIPFYEFSKLN